MKIIVFSQEKTLNIGVNYSPVFNNYNFNNPVYDYFGWETSFEYKSKYNYSTGISFEYVKKLYLGTSINYTTKGYVIEYNYTPLFLNDPAIPIQANVEAGYLDFNLGIGYNYNLNKTISFIPNIKLTYSGLINDKITTLYADNSEYTSEDGEGILIKQDLKKHLFSTGLGVDIRINILKSFSIGVEPSILYSFNEISEKAIKNNTAFYSVKVGLYYRLIKN